MCSLTIVSSVAASQVLGSILSSVYCLCGVLRVPLVFARVSSVGFVVTVVTGEHVALCRHILFLL